MTKLLTKVCYFCLEPFETIACKQTRCSLECTVRSALAEFSNGDQSRCFEWTGARNANGYGEIRRDKHLYLVHRVSFKIANGYLNDDLFVLHQCDNPPCFNPQHLFEGTNLDNMADMDRKGRRRTVPLPFGEDHHQARFTVKDIADIRSRLKAGETHRSIANLYDVGYGAIGKIARRETWAWVS